MDKAKHPLFTRLSRILCEMSLPARYFQDIYLPQCQNTGYGCRAAMLNGPTAPKLFLTRAGTLRADGPKSRFYFTIKHNFDVGAARSMF